MFWKYIRGCCSVVCEEEYCFLICCFNIVFACLTNHYLLKDRLCYISDAYTHRKGLLFFI